MKNLLALTLPGSSPISENLGDLPGAPTSLQGFREDLVGATPATIINLIVPLIFAIAGVVLFIMLIAGGLTIFTSAGNPEAMKKGQSRIVSALIGLVIIFAAYWIVQLIEYSLGLSLLGGAAVTP